MLNEKKKLENLKLSNWVSLVDFAVNEILFGEFLEKKITLQKKKQENRRNIRANIKKD